MTVSVIGNLVACGDVVAFADVDSLSLGKDDLLVKGDVYVTKNITAFQDPDFKVDAGDRFVKGTVYVTGNVTAYFE